VSRQLAEMMDGTLRYVGASDESRFELSLPLSTDQSSQGVLIGSAPADAG
jgi:hypothetical protein